MPPAFLVSFSDTAILGRWLDVWRPVNAPSGMSKRRPSIDKPNVAPHWIGSSLWPKLRQFICTILVKYTWRVLLSGLACKEVRPASINIEACTTDSTGFLNTLICIVAIFLPWSESYEACCIPQGLLILRTSARDKNRGRWGKCTLALFRERHQLHGEIAEGRSSRLTERYSLPDVK